MFISRIKESIFRLYQKTLIFRSEYAICVARRQAGSAFPRHPAAPSLVAVASQQLGSSSAALPFASSLGNFHLLLWQLSGIVSLAASFIVSNFIAASVCGRRSSSKGSGHILWHFSWCLSKCSTFPARILLPASWSLHSQQPQQFLIFWLCTTDATTSRVLCIWHFELAFELLCLWLYQ